MHSAVHSPGEAAVRASGSIRASRIVLAIAMGLGAAGCGGRLVRLEAEGAHDEVIERAERMRWGPRRAAARAYAAALHARGRSEQARDVLLRDYRRGGELKSLVALADLELALGRDGVAAVHFARVAALERRVLRGRKDVCDLFERRAEAFVELGDGDAALDDYERTQALCRRAPPRAAIDRARSLAREQRDARVDRTRCKTEDCAATRASARVQEVAKALADARTPVDLRRVAARWAAALEPAQVVSLLLADARGQAGPDLVDDDELRAWIGEADVESFRAGVQALAPAEGAYARLRLERIFGAPPDGGPSGATQRLLWLDRALVMDGVVAWRVLAFTGDLAGTELAIASVWRPAAAAPSGPKETGTVTVGEHWAMRVAPSADSIPALLLVARLRAAAGEQDLALELVRSIARRADAAAVPGVNAIVAREAARALAWGRPWTALAIADALPRAELDPIRAAAASGILLGTAVCAGPCPDDDDRAVAERVLGTAWIAEVEPRLRELALARARTLARADGCSTLAEVFAPDATGPLPRALADLRRNPTAPGADAALVAAIESDVALACTGWIAVPLLSERTPVLGAGRLAEMLAHGPEMRAAEVVALHAALALVAGDGPRAEALAIAAAGEAHDPVRSWRELAEVARATDSRDLEMMALREIVLAQADVDEPVARRELLAHALHDIVRSWGVRETPAGQEASRRHVVDWLDEGAPAQRWGRRERLVAAVADRPWSSNEHRDAIADVLLPVGPVRAAHPVAAARLGLSARTLDGATTSPSALAWLAARRQIASAPATIEVFAAVERLEDARLAFARSARDWGVRRRQAIGLATYGTPAARVRAVAALVELTAEVPEARRELEQLLLDAPAAIEPDTRGEGMPRVAGLVDDRHALLRLVFGLPLEPALFLAGDEPFAGAGP